MTDRYANETPEHREERLRKQRERSRERRGRLSTGRPAGRPPMDDEPLEKATVTLRASDIAKAKRLGKGKISAGVREALDRVE